MDKEKSEEFFNKNIGLAYKVANTYKNNYYYEMEDIKQIALGALWKAVVNYNQSIAKFSTFAVTIIRNDINYYLRRTKKYRSDISLNTELKNSCEGNREITLQDVLSDDSDKLIEEAEDKMFLIDLFSNINLTEEEKIILKDWLQGRNQIETAKTLNISQASISRCITKLKQKLIYYKNKNL